MHELQNNPIELLEQLNACSNAIEWIEKNNIRTLQEAWEKCERGDWMLWLYAKMYPEKVRERVLAAGHCANTVRHLMQDLRSIGAVDIAITFPSAYSAYASASYTSAASAAYSAAAAAYSAASATDVYAADDAYKQNQKETADICRKYLSLGLN